MLPFFDPYYFLIIGPFLALAMWAQFRVKGTFHHWSRVPIRSGVSGAEAAQLILSGAGIHDVRIEAVHGLLADHYDPRVRTVRLSEQVLHERSVAAVAVAAHEVGHAIQHAQAYRPMEWRAQLLPLVNITNTLALPMFLVGILFLGTGFAWFAVALFSVGLLFHLVTLPVEFDASARAIRILERSGIALPEEMQGVRKTLYAAGFTYLAATLVAAAELFYWLLRSGLIGGRSND